MNSAPIEISKGKYRGHWGTYWVWECDGIFDVYFVRGSEEGPDKTDVISVCWELAASHMEDALERIDWEIARSRIDEMLDF